MNINELELILPQVEKPTRYIGGEWNAVLKDPAKVDLRLCLVFPDLYELGLGNLGLQILYAILNDMENVWAERAYLPAPDMEKHLREYALPLFMLESKAPVAAADAIGFTLQSELTYVNVLKVLELARIPFFSKERDNAVPLVFAGGPGAYNPEPLAPFMDFFVVGDGEDVIIEIAQCLIQHKQDARRKKLEALAAIEGVYVPLLYPTETNQDGSIIPRLEKKIRARFAPSLNVAPFPESIITPYMQMVHDGVGIEVLRGCTHGCRFCLAGMINRPVRERDASVTLNLLEKTLAGTGFDAATLLSLSTCDHSEIRRMLQETSSCANTQCASISLPSLRLNRFSVELADYVSSMRRSGLTFAPEAGTPRLRAVINKDVSDDQLIEIAEEVFRRGWQHIKTYFMIGLPTETEEDVNAIADLCRRVLDAGRRINRRAMLRTGVSTFVPKPFTPFQWARQIGIEETRAKQQHLGLLFGKIGRHIKYGRHAPEASYIEGLLSRADRRAAPLLLSVLRHGGGFETWEERLNFNAWRTAIEETGYAAQAALAERALDTPLPWDRIDAAVSKEALVAEWYKAIAGQYTADCRDGICNQCGANRHAAAQCRAIQLRATTGRSKDEQVVLEEQPESEIKESIQRLRFRVGREGMLRFMSHLETAQAWVRALRRAGAPLAYSQGFHAHPKVTFSTALPVGEESEAELMDVVLQEHREPAALLASLQVMLPEGLNVYEVWDVDLRAPSLMAAQTGLEYALYTSLSFEETQKRLAVLQQRDAWPVERNVKSRQGGGPAPGRKTVMLDIRPMISSIHAVPTETGGACIQYITKLHEGRLAKAREVLELLNITPNQARILKTGTLLQQ